MTVGYPRVHPVYDAQDQTKNLRGSEGRKERGRKKGEKERG